MGQTFRNISVRMEEHICSLIWRCADLSLQKGETFDFPKGKSHSHSMVYTHFRNLVFRRNVAAKVSLIDIFKF